MLTGRLDPDDAPPGYAPVAELLAAASSPPDASELAGESSVVAVFAAAARSHPCAPLGRRRPRRWPRGRHGRRLYKGWHLRAVLAGAMLGVLAVSGVAAATGELPVSAQQVAHKVLGRAGVPAPGAAAKGRGLAATTTSRATRVAAQESPTTQRSPTTTSAQDAARVLMLNLCHAWSDWSDHQRQRSGGDGWDGRYGSGGDSTGSTSAGAGSDGDWRHFTQADLFTLWKAAGSLRRIPTYCRHLAEGGNIDGSGTPSSGADTSAGAAATSPSSSSPPPSTNSSRYGVTTTTWGRYGR